MSMSRYPLSSCFGARELVLRNELTIQSFLAFISIPQSEAPFSVISHVHARGR